MRHLFYIISYYMTHRTISLHLGSVVVRQLLTVMRRGMGRRPAVSAAPEALFQRRQLAEEFLRCRVGIMHHPLPLTLMSTVTSYEYRYEL